METLVHECTHYFELANLYDVLFDGICHEDDNLRLMRQLSEYSAKKNGYKYYYTSLDHYGVFDQDYVNLDLRNQVEFYSNLLAREIGLPRFLYYQIRLLAVITAWKEYYHNDIAERLLLPCFFDISIKDALLDCLSVDLEKASKSDVLTLGNDFMKILNSSPCFIKCL